MSYDQNAGYQPQDQVPPQYAPTPAYPQQPAPQPAYGYGYGQSPAAPQAPAAVVVNVTQSAARRKAVVKTRKNTSHGLHLVLTICTGGGWGIFVWLPLTMWHKYGPRQKTVTRYR